jgi:hypothetical protein
MARMIRKQVRIDPSSERFLKERSRQLGITESEIVRRALKHAAREASVERSMKSDDDKPTGE